MKVMKNGEKLQTLFDYKFLDKVIQKDENGRHIGGTWYVLEERYVMNSSTKQYLHHLIMDFKPAGRGFQQISIDHLDGDELNNRRGNLDYATPKQQQENSKGRIEGTKRNRQKTAIDLPDGIKQSELPQYVNYRDEENKKYFVIEEHPVYTNQITINGNPVKKIVKSIQALWLNQYDKSQGPYPARRKLEEIVAKCNKLDEIYKIAKKNNTKNVDIEEDEIIESFYKQPEKTDDTKATPVKVRKARNTKIIYKYDKNRKFVAKYGSLKYAAKRNAVSDKTINRVKRSSTLCQGHYYRENPFYSEDEDAETEYEPEDDSESDQDNVIDQDDGQE